MHHRLEQHLDARPEPVSSLAVDDAGKRRVPGGDLRQQSLPLAARRECHHAEVIPLAVEYTERALADRAGGAQHRNAARAAILGRAHPGIPKRV
jgi:hypothetical protein